MTLIERLNAYFRQCSPHVAERQAARLIREAATALETLASDNERLTMERDEAVDMQAVGRGVMEAQACSAWHWFMAAWAPAMCPSEFVYDALNALDELKARADLAEKANGELREALTEYFSALDAEAKAESTLTTAMDNYTEWHTEQSAYDAAFDRTTEAAKRARSLTPTSDKESHDGK